MGIYPSRPMKRFLIALSIILFTALTVTAQNDARRDSVATIAAPAFRFGFLSCDSVLHAMPDYITAKKNLATLQAKYDAEMKRVEDEFNEKYELFLEGQRDFAPSILQKRQAELQELMEKNTAFKEEARRLMAEATKEAIDPIRVRLGRAIRQVGQAHGLAFILNTDNNAVPYTDAGTGEDISGDVLKATMQK